MPFITFQLSLSFSPSTSLSPSPSPPPLYLPLSPSTSFSSPLSSSRRNKDEDDEVPEWQWTVRENPASKRSDKPSAISVAVPTVPDVRLPEPETPPVTEDHTSSVPEYNGVTNNGPVVGVQGEDEPMEEEQEAPPPAVHQKVCYVLCVCVCGCHCGTYCF